jgi:hypothetical protein
MMNRGRTDTGNGEKEKGRLGVKCHLHQFEKDAGQMEKPRKNIVVMDTTIAKANEWENHFNL